MRAGQTPQTAHGLQPGHYCLHRESLSALPLDVVHGRDLLLGRAAELHSLEEARGRVEAKYLDCTRALFAARARGDEQRRQSEAMGVITIRLAELDGHSEPAGKDQAAREARIGRLVADMSSRRG